MEAKPVIQHKDFAVWNKELTKDQIGALAAGTTVTNVPINKGEWNHVAMTTSDKTASFWLNGEDVTSTTITSAANALTTHYCADCFSKDYKTKNPAEFLAEGFSVCEEHFIRYCEIKKDKYRADGTWNGR